MHRIKDRLISASPNQIFLVPYNASAHWVLTVIDPDNDIVYFMDPLKRRLGGNGEWKDIVDTAISMFRADRNKKGRGFPQWKNMAGIPSQPNDKQCGYFVMRYMRDIIHDTNLGFAEKWGRRANHVYSQVEIDEVRNELASYVLKNILKL
ncbi:uncharacterized protein LOC112183893 [Rosa chinensis]|uniref:uncharacterized protein LOC112183893 n=1 Tax=Rosa chinensis TaxID=74649 RepID=UPI000D0921FF|nr:uncharacterized protein LOC112183893 [Rosa chinensis]